MKKQKTIKLTEDEHTREMQEIAKMRANYLNDRSADGHKDETKFTISENVQVFNPDFRPDTPLDTLQAPKLINFNPVEKEDGALTISDEEVEEPSNRAFM